MSKPSMKSYSVTDPKSASLAQLASGRRLRTLSTIFGIQPSRKNLQFPSAGASTSPGCDPMASARHPPRHTRL